MSAAQKNAVRQVAVKLLNGNTLHTPTSAIRQAIGMLRAGIVRPA